MGWNSLSAYDAWRQALPLPPVPIWLPEPLRSADTLRPGCVRALIAGRRRDATRATVAMVVESQAADALVAAGARTHRGVAPGAWPRGVEALKASYGPGATLLFDERPAMALLAARLLEESGWREATWASTAMPERHPETIATIPLLIKVRAKRLDEGRGRRSALRIGAFTARLSTDGCDRGKGKDVQWYLLIAPPTGLGAFGANAGFIWHADLGVWGTTSLRMAAQAAAYAEPDIATALERQGLPERLQRHYRHTPALAPWKGHWWALLASRQYRHQYRPPNGRGWKEAGRYEGWQSRQGTDAWHMRAFAPPELARKIEERFDTHVLEALEEAAIDWGPMEAGFGSSARKAAATAKPSHAVVICRCANLALIDETIARGEGHRCERERACTARTENGPVPRTGVTPEVLLEIGARERASPAAWRKITETIAHTRLAPRKPGPALHQSIEAAIPCGKQLRPGQGEAIEAALVRDVCLNGAPTAAGKTIVSLLWASVLAARKRNGPRSVRILAIVPAKVRLKWAREARQWLDPAIAIHTPSPRDPAPGPGTLAIASYECASTSKHLRRGRWDAIVADEAHAMRNATSARSQAIGTLRARRWLFLSATPIEASAQDLQPLLAKADPELFGDARAMARAYRIADPDHPSRAELAMLDRLGQLMRDTILFRPAKERVLHDLPRPLPEEIVEVEVADRRPIDEAWREVCDADGYGPDVRARVWAFQRAVGRAKAERAAQIAAQIAREDGPAIVFVQYREVSDRIMETLEREGARAAVADGRRSADERMALMDAFEAGRTDVLVVSYQAGGEGLDLPRAAGVVLAEMTWLATPMVQAIGRAQRPGRTGRLRIVYLAIPDSIDARIARRAMARDQAARAALGDETMEEATRSWLSEYGIGGSNDLRKPTPGLSPERCEQEGRRETPSRTGKGTRAARRPPDADTAPNGERNENHETTTR